jgi:hypothetical protein
MFSSFSDVSKDIIELTIETGFQTY